MIFPGKYQRIDALKNNSIQAAQLLMGIVPMLLMAGTIEGFFSPSPIVPNPIKYLVGTTIFCLLILYCLRKKKAEV
jgi:uncharacterized membrane protein SpoIIM required for sporulation